MKKLDSFNATINPRNEHICWNPEMPEMEEEYYKAKLAER